MRLLPLALLIALPIAAQEPAPPVEEDPAAVCVKRLASDDPEVRGMAYRDLKKLRRKAIPALEAGRKHEDPEVAAACEDLLAVIRSAQIFIEGGPLAPGTPWWKAREIPVTVDFRETPLSEIIAAFPEDLGYSLKVQPLGAEPAARRVTLKFDKAPLEFVLGWLLWSCGDRNLAMQGMPRLGWGHRDVWFVYDQRPAGERSTVDYGRGDALAGVSDTDIRALAAFLDEVARSEDRSSSVKAGDGGVRIVGTPWVQAEASRVMDDLRRSAGGLPAPGAEFDAVAVKAGASGVSVSWWPATFDDAVGELQQRTGVRIGIDPRARNWTDSQAWYRSQNEEPVTAVLQGLCERISNARVEQRWGGYWIVVDMNPQNTRQFWVGQVGAFVRDMSLADAAWQPPALEAWIRSHLRNSQWGGTQATLACAFLPDSGRFALYGNRSAHDLLRSLLDGRRRETELRRASLGVPGPAIADSADAAAIEARLLARLGRDKITKEQPSQGFEENRVFQEVFSVLHDALDVRSTSGSWGGMNNRNTLRACRLKEVSPRVLWAWLDSGIPFFLYYYPDRRAASYGIGTTQPWDGWVAPTWFTRGRIHGEHEKAFMELLHAMDPAARKSLADVPPVAASPAGGPVCLPRSGAEKLFRLLALDGKAPAEAPGAAPRAEALAKTVKWPGGKHSLEEALFKLAELCDMNFVLDVATSARVTKKLETPEGELTAREVLERAVSGAGVGWSVGDEQVVWVTSRPGDGRVWQPLAGGVALGAEEAEAVAAEFAKATGDELVVFAPTGRFLARCAVERASGAQAAFTTAIAAARAAAAEEAAALEEAAAAGGEVPRGFPGALALEKAAGSPETRFALAVRIAAGGFARDALRRFTELAAAPGIPAALAARARGRAALLAVKFGPGEMRMDAVAIELARAVEEQADAPKEALADALAARAEALRRAGDRDGALAALRRLEELGIATDDSRRWVARIEGLR